MPLPTPVPLTPIAGLFLDPRPADVSERRNLPPQPAPTFAPILTARLDQTLLFDIKAGTATNLGAGFRRWFSPDGLRMA